MISRRRFFGIAGGAVAAGTGITGVGLAFVPPAATDTGGGPAPQRNRGSTSVTELRGPEAPADGGTVRRHTLTAQQATVKLPSGGRVDAWTYNGQVPGPPITATEGDLVEVRLRNDDVEDGVTVHWHGYEVPNREDGAPDATQEAVRPGEEYVYRFRADQVGTYWYHTHQMSHRGVRRGLYGPLVVSPRTNGTSGLDLTLPVHTFGGATVVDTSDRPIDRRVAPGTDVRLRLVNTDSTPHRFTLAGTPFRVVTVDGRELHGPGRLTATALRLAAGARYDLAFAMPDDSVTLLVDGNATTSLRLRPDRASDAAPADDTSDWPELDWFRYGTPAPTPFDRNGPFDRDFTLVLDRGLAFVDGMPRYAHTVNGQGFPSIPTQLVREGDLVRLTVVNRSLETHPWHLHGHSVLVLSRNGQTPTGSPLWVDTFDVRPGETWQVGFRANNPGLWMNHCHNLPHADQGMMLHLAYEGVTSPFHE